MGSPGKRGSGRHRGMSRYGGPPAAGAAGGRQIALPNQTIYINNLNEKLPEQQLRRFPPLCRAPDRALASGAGAFRGGASRSCPARAILLAGRGVPLR